MATGGNSKKIGNKIRVPSQKRYTNEMRWEKNSRKKILKEAKRVEKNSVKEMKVPQGTCRRMRRASAAQKALAKKMTISAFLRSQLPERAKEPLCFCNGKPIWSLRDLRS